MYSRIKALYYLWCEQPTKEDTAWPLLLHCGLGGACDNCDSDDSIVFDDCDSV